MPFKPADNPKCPKCGKSVYAAEERVAGGLKWHKMCFKCGLCSKFLDSTNCSEHEGELYCKVCHARKFGPKGYGFGGGAGCLSMDKGEHLVGEQEGGPTGPRDVKAIAKAPPGEGCPRCGGFVYAAEQMLAKGRAWHRECFKCNECSKHLDSILVCEAPDKEIYCKVCYGKKFGPKGYGYGQGGGALQSDPSLMANGEIPAPRIHVMDTAVIKAEPGKGCPRCSGVVFAAEEVLAKGRPWHRKCFKCRQCKRVLDSIIACDGPDNDVYCKTCYGKNWGPHGYGFACGSGFLQTDGLTEEEISKSRPFYNPDTTSIKAQPGQGCPRCGGAVFAAEQQLAKGTMWHKKCFNCCDCHRPLDSMLACDGPDKEIYCKACYGKKFGPKGFGFGHSPTLVANGESVHLHTDMKPTGGKQAPDGKGCSRCKYPVYAAELMISKEKIWHKRCFNCSECHRSLDSTNLNDGPDFEIYCRGCYARHFGPKGCGFGMVSYGKKFGPKGYGYGQGGGALQSDPSLMANGEIPAPRIHVMDTAVIKAEPGKGCPRCGGVVFAAEEVLAKGRPWHRKCFKCRQCKRVLDSIIACDGPDNDVYCKTCYGKNWGPHGYGFACGSGFLQTDGLTEEEISKSRPFYNPDTTSIKAQPGQGCPRCGGAVFAAEQQLAKGTMWHKKCFNCCDCHRPLDSMLACDGPDKEIYCKACYGKKFGPKGFGFGHSPTLVANGESVHLHTDMKPTGGKQAPDGKGCSRCKYPVYAAELMISKEKIWHKRCFNCSECHRSLDSTNLNDGPDFEIYCRGCYARHFGPKGCGFGMGAGALTMA